MMFEHKGIQYDLEINTGKLKIIENATKRSLIGEWVTNNGMLPLQTGEAVFQVCLKKAGSSDFVDQVSAIQIYNDLLEEKGYSVVMLHIQTALQRDMGFLFRAS